MTYEYQTLEIALDAGVMTVTINNPPVNVMTVALFTDLCAFTEQVAADESVRVVVFDSADPDFFIAHFDLELILAFPTEQPARYEQQPNDFHLMCERLRTMPKPTIARLAGRVGGGGSEFAASCDMRFGVADITQVSQMEVALGILPGGTGTQRLPRLVGRGRALEICLGCEDIDARTAHEWGYLNRLFESRQALDDWVNTFARRVACWPPQAVALCKQSINNAELPLAEGLREEAYLFQQSLRGPAATPSMRAALALGAQTRPGESRIGELCAEVAQQVASPSGGEDGE
jgi:enoyl-CoA hydratase/carnithine racemase